MRGREYRELTDAEYALQRRLYDAAGEPAGLSGVFGSSVYDWLDLLAERPERPRDAPRIVFDHPAAFYIDGERYNLRVGPWRFDLDSSRGRWCYWMVLMARHAELFRRYVVAERWF